MNNQSKEKFNKIDSEEYREYKFVRGGKEVTVRIDAPLELAVRESGAHMVYDAAGKSHYIPKDFYHLTWKAKPGAPNFVA